MWNFLALEYLDPAGRLSFVLFVIVVTFTLSTAWALAIGSRNEYKSKLNAINQLYIATSNASNRYEDQAGRLNGMMKDLQVQRQMLQTDLELKDKEIEQLKNRDGVQVSSSMLSGMGQLMSAVAQLITTTKKPTGELATLIAECAHKLDTTEYVPNDPHERPV